jgi:hypothetical protein
MRSVHSSTPFTSIIRSASFAPFKGTPRSHGRASRRSSSPGSFAASPVLDCRPAVLHQRPPDPERLEVEVRSSPATADSLEPCVFDPSRRRRAREGRGVEVTDLVPETLWARSSLDAFRELPALRGALVAVVVHGRATISGGARGRLRVRGQD